MIKSLVAVIMVLSLIFISGCSEIAGPFQTVPPAAPEIIRKAELGSEWQMNQMRFELGVGNELSILLRLAAGDIVDGYFYLEKGNNIGFQITGDSLIYRSETEGAAVSERVSSDRFTFVAGEAQGTTYTLVFSNTADNGTQRMKATVFLEIIYPLTGAVFIPIEAE